MIESDISDEFCDDTITSDFPRKRKVNKEKWKKVLNKKAKHAEKASKLPVISCNHSSTFCDAVNLSDDNIKTFHKRYWENDTAVSQSNFLCNFIDVIEPVRNRPSKNPKGMPKGDNDRVIKYFVPNKKGKIQVCRNSFLSILNVGRRKVENAAKFKRDGTVVKENRGGDRSTESTLNIKRNIIDHISKFKCREKHYGRNKAPRRKYLPSDLSIKKMWQMFCKEHQNVDANKDFCNYEYYYKIFVENFNLRFGSIKLDTCSDCAKFSVRFKTSTDAEEKKMIICERMLHKRKAKVFFEKLNSFPENTVSINFDLMQNQPLPKSNVTEAYYLRQIWYYLLGIVIHNENKSLASENVHFYRWYECDGGRGAAEISSCLWLFLEKNIVKFKDNNVKCIRLFSDSCASQNKNYTVLFMLCVFATKYDIEVEWFFPIRGHSYMPADRAFGLVEKKLKKKESVLYPEVHDDVVKTVGTLNVINNDFTWVNFQEMSEKFAPKKKTFKISESRKLKILGTGKVEIYKNYLLDPTCQHSMLKKGANYYNAWCYLKNKECTNHIKEKKMLDVEKLLKVLGYNISNMIFYKDIKPINDYHDVTDVDIDDEVD